MYYVMRASAPSLHRESTDSLIHIFIHTVHSMHMCASVWCIKHPPAKCFQLDLHAYTGNRLQ